MWPLKTNPDWDSNFKEAQKFCKVKKLNSELKMKSQAANLCMADQPGMPLLDDNQPVINLIRDDDEVLTKNKNPFQSNY